MLAGQLKCVTSVVHPPPTAKPVLVMIADQDDALLVAGALVQEEPAEEVRPPPTAKPLLVIAEQDDSLLVAGVSVTDIKEKLFGNQETKSSSYYFKNVTHITAI